MNILVLCQEDNHRKLLPAYVRALQAKGALMYFVDPGVALDAPLAEIVARCERRPDWILHVESDFPLLPKGLVSSQIPTLCFHVDTYAFTRRRIRWSSLFDGVAVFHPGYDRVFAEAGHPGAFVLPHAVQGELYDKPERDRVYEVAWVGNTAGAIYYRRRKWLPRLAQEFRMNDWKRSHTLAEVADIYSQAKVVVNLGRDDFPQDANMRVYEVMASGALLITSLPSELSELGFKEGRHFVGYHDEEDLVPSVRYYLEHEGERLKIAGAGREKTLQEDTYECRAAQLLQVLSDGTSALKAPGRSWPEASLRLVYVDFFSAQGAIDLAAAQLRGVVRRDLRADLESVLLLAKGWARQRIGSVAKEVSVHPMADGSRGRLKTINSMRRDWNERARKDAFLYIASWKDDWNEEAFFASGEADYQRLVEPILAKLGVRPAGSALAELGSGAGRMTRALARRFRAVTAIDISEEMQTRAKSYLKDSGNVRWVLTDGISLGGVETGSMDFVFSYLVLQHYPSAELIAGSIQEMMRILRPGGAFLFQFNGSQRATMNWRGRALSSALDGLCSIGLKRFAQACAHLARIDPEMIGKTWRGVALRSEEVDTMVRSVGGVPSGFEGENSPLAWCFGRKASQGNP